MKKREGTRAEAMRISRLNQIIEKLEWSLAMLYLERKGALIYDKSGSVIGAYCANCGKNAVEVKDGYAFCSKCSR